MISISTLWCRDASSHNQLRYGTGSELRSGAERKPVVVLTLTRRCNLACKHCYNDSSAALRGGELTTPELEGILRQLADFGVPAVLFSGGEPLLHPDIFHLLELAQELGLKVSLSTNGTMLNLPAAQRLKQVGVTYAGISLDSTDERANDHFRGKPGAYQGAVIAFKNCREAGLPAGLRFTLTHFNQIALPGVFKFLEENQILRVCFYHLGYSGRGSNIQGADLSRLERRKALDFIIEATGRLHQNGILQEVLTVNNPSDGVYLYLKKLKNNPLEAEKIKEYLEWNGGGRYGAGVGLCCIDETGELHPDQFWNDCRLGSLREKSFRELWLDSPVPFLRELREREKHIQGRCRDCKFFALCGGGMRSRAAEALGDPWGEDPSCLLYDQEISD